MRAFIEKCSKLAIRMKGDKMHVVAKGDDGQPRARAKRPRDEGGDGAEDGARDGGDAYKGGDGGDGPAHAATTAASGVAPANKEQPGSAATIACTPSLAAGTAASNGEAPTQSAGKYPCSECKERFGSRNKLFTHLRSTHGHPAREGDDDEDAEKAARKKARKEAKRAKRAAEQS